MTKIAVSFILLAIIYVVHGAEELSLSIKTGFEGALHHLMTDETEDSGDGSCKKVEDLEKSLDDYKKETESHLADITLRLDAVSRTRSCKDVAIATGERRDGIYLIQPSTLYPAFNVKCHFNGNTVITSVEHNSEDELSVSDCNPRKCYMWNVTYDATIPQMRSLIDLGGDCRQYIKYQCYHSRIFQNGYNFAGWESWNGTARHYWGGSGGRDGYCACGVTGTCAQSYHKCNCDANDNVWREDSGYLTQQEDLPVTKLYFGDADAPSELGRHTLGTLQCEQTL